MALICLARSASTLAATGPLDHAVAAGYGEGDTARWTFRDGTFLATSDRLGLVPFYYHETSGGLLCADHITELLQAGVPRRLDPVAVVLSHGLGYCPGDLTIFDGIKRLPASAELRATGSETTVRAAMAVPQQNEYALEPALNAYADLFERSVRTLAGREGRIVVPLSGGRDSRHVLFAACAAGLDAETVTFKNFPPTGKDLSAALEIRRELGCRHRVVENSEYDYHRSLVRALPEIQFESLEHGWIWSLVPHLAELTLPFFDGLGGDVLSNALYFSPDANRKLREGDTAGACQRFEERALGQSRVAHFLSAAEKERLRVLLREEMSRWREWPNPLVAFVFFNRTRRGAACAPLAISRLAGAPVAFPYLERHVFDFLIGLDERFFAEPGFHDAVIARKYPQYAHIPYGKGVPAPIGYARSVKNAFAYLAGRPKIDGLDLEDRARWIGLVRILFGGDFVAESWRFQDFDLVCAIARVQALRA